MREIKFRGKNNNKWIYGDLLHIGITTQIDNGFGGHFVEENTIGQYTGLHDKNGTEIYEGDIVKVTYKGKEDIGKIIYEYNGFIIDVMNMNRNYGRVSLIGRYTEVIGNIYDNPDLLKGEENG